MSGDEILHETRNHVAVITLNRPAALNALSLDMIIALRELLTELASDKFVLAVLLRGAGDRAFCAGGDIRALYQSYREGRTLHREFFIREYPLDYMLHFYPKPYVALMDGITMGGGMGLSQGSTLRVVGDATRIAMPEVAIGFFPDVGASYFLPRLPGALGHYLALTGIQITGADALYAQLADAYLPAAATASLGDDLEAIEWRDDPRTSLREFIHSRAARGLTAPSLSLLRSGIDRHFSHASVPAILASLEGESRPELAGWAGETVKLMRGRSPLMLCVTLRELQLGRELSLGACLRMELSLTQQCFDRGDFMEGVRALLIDKDKQPRWNPPSIEQVTGGMIDAFFVSPWTASGHPLANFERL